MIREAEKAEIAVVGAGISGLTLAYYLANSGRKVTVFERNRSVGGFLDSIDLNGTLIEKYYHHLMMNCNNVINLAKEIGMPDEIVWKDVRMGFLYKNRLFAFNGPWDLLNFKPLAFCERMRLGFGIFKLSMAKDWEYFDSFTAEELLRKNTGGESFEKLWKPLLKMKFGGAYKQVSGAWIWDRIKTRRSSQRLGKSKECLGYVKGGFRRIADRLAELIAAKGGEVLLSSPVIQISSLFGQSVNVCYGKDKNKSFSKLFSTIALPILVKTASFLPNQTVAMIQKIEYQNVVCVLIRLKKRLTGFYWINLVDDEIPFGAIVEHTNFVDASEYQGDHIIYLVKYCSKGDDFFIKDDPFVKDKAREALRKLSAGFSEKDIIKEEVFRDAFAQPVFCKGFAEIRNRLRECEEIDLADTSQVYPDSRSIDSAILLAKVKADYLIKNDQQ